MKMRMAALLLPVLVLPAVVRAELASGVKAIVHDSVITYQEVELSAAPALQLAWTQNRNNPEAFNRKRAQVLGDALEELIQRKLILHDFEAAGYNLPESVIEDNVQQRIRDRYRGDRRVFAKSLKEEGMTFERFRQQVRETTIVEYLRWKNTSAEIIISPAKIQKYYEDHAKDYQVEDQVKLRMIVLNKNGTNTQARALADDIENKLKDGADFGQMARVYSQGSQRTKDGEWGWATRDGLQPKLAEVAFKLKAGERSPIIELDDHIYLMLVEEVKFNHLRPLSEVRDDIEKNLLVSERARLARLYTDKLKAKTFIRYF
jgi:peptidyl-prolyl cis-trans isomerase SurA